VPSSGGIPLSFWLSCCLQPADCRGDSKSAEACAAAVGDKIGPGIGGVETQAEGVGTTAPCGHARDSLTLSPR
jgi:hypothetical protein